jgi:ribose transport system permease protein
MSPTQGNATAPILGAGQEQPPETAFAKGRATRIARLRLAGALLAVIILPIIFTSAQSSYLSSGNLQSIGRQVAILLLVAAAATAPILMGSIDLSVGAMLSLTSVVAAIAAQHWGAAAVFVVLPLGVVLGFINGVVISWLRLPSFLVTLGSSFIFAGIALAISGGFPEQLPLGGSATVTSMLDGVIGGWLPSALLWALGFWLLAIVILSRSVFGRYVYAVGGNERAAITAGVPVQLTKTLAFALSGGLSAMAGILVLFQTTAATADIGSSYLLTSIAAVVIGGTPLSGGEGNVARSLIGALVLTELLNGMLILGVSAAAQQIVQGGVVVLAVMLTLDRKRLGIVK